MKEVLLSIRPEWCELIVKGRKTVEVRKTKPKLNTPFKCYIYCTKSKLFTKSHYNGKIYVATSKKYQNSLEHNGNITLSGKVIGEFVCDEITRIVRCGYDNERIELNIVDQNLTIKKLDEVFLSRCQLSYSDIEKYANGGDVYGWHISDLVIYDEPKELSDFYTKCNELCDNCDLWESVRMNEEYDMECASKRYGYVPIKRPAQSWCYVEGVKE